MALIGAMAKKSSDFTVTRAIALSLRVKLALIYSVNFLWQNQL